MCASHQTMTHSLSPPVFTPPSFWQRAIPRLTTLTNLAFAVYILLNLTTPSWRYGPFAWFSLVTIEEWAGAPVQLGLFNLLPVLIVGGWGTQLLWHWYHQTSRPVWGWWGITLPLMLFTWWGLLSLDEAPTRRTLIQGIGLALAWLIFLYTLQHPRDWSRPLLLIVFIQSLIALGQFFRQQDLGLVYLGELPLNPHFTGITVLNARDVNWLRAYGLTTHPNQLGALLAGLLLILIPAWYVHWRQQRPQAITFLFSLTIGLGAAALYVTFSRAAILGFLVGLFLLAASGDFTRRRPPANTVSSPGFWPYSQTVLHLCLILLPPIFVLLAYGDLALSRLFHLEQPLEATSINDRVVAIEVAQEVIELNWLKGVGLGNYADYARSAISLDAFTVHNIPLLMVAELGLPGGFLWLWLALAPFLYLLYRRVRSPATRLDHESEDGFTLSLLAPWAAMFVIGLFDVTLWLTTHWQTAILYGLFLAHLHYPLAHITPLKKGQNRAWCKSRHTVLNNLEGDFPNRPTNL